MVRQSDRHGYRRAGLVSCHMIYTRRRIHSYAVPPRYRTRPGTSVWQRQSAAKTLRRKRLYLAKTILWQYLAGEVYLLAVSIRRRLFVGDGLCLSQVAVRRLSRGSIYDRSGGELLSAGSIYPPKTEDYAWPLSIWRRLAAGSRRPSVGGTYPALHLPRTVRGSRCSELEHGQHSLTTNSLELAGHPAPAAKVQRARARRSAPGDDAASIPPPSLKAAGSRPGARADITRAVQIISHGPTGQPGPDRAETGPGPDRARAVAPQVLVRKWWAGPGARAGGLGRRGACLYTRV
jgi:hypothetical protein